MRRRAPVAFLAAVAAVVLSRSVSAIEFVEPRGDFYYDAHGRFQGVRHADFPPGFERRPLSHRERAELRGIRLPERPATWTPRPVAPKPARVREGDGYRHDQIAVKFVEGVRVRLRDGILVAAGAPVAPVARVLARYPEAEVQRLFSTAERILDEDKDTGERISGKQLADLNNWYLLRLPEPSGRGPALANELLALDVVETAYLPSEAEPPVCSDISPPTPLWESDQFYLDPAPDGVDAFFAWGYHAGGDGAGPDFWVVDCEWNWCLTHEDLDIDLADVVNGLTAGGHSQDHGTAVIAEIGACDNEYGVTGISHDVALKMADFDSEPSWAANITTAASVLTAGEIILLEIQIVGPDTGDPHPGCGAFERVPVEWDQASFDAIETATANGIIVVEAAGNGAVSLDHPAYEGAFDRTIRDSGAILVAAAEPGSHSPECFTNHGTRIDCHAYGSGVYSAGYGDLFDGFGCSQDYTDTFSGTSAASPIIVGVCASMQGIAIEKHGFVVSPALLRDLIQVGGTPQGPPTSKIIRDMPNLVSAIAALESPVGAPELVTPPSALASPQPNPFRLDTVIRFDVPREQAAVLVTVHNLAGRRIATLVDGERPAGPHLVEWDGVDSAGQPVAAGVYVVRLETDGAVETRKVTRIR